MADVTTSTDIDTFMQAADNAAARAALGAGDMTKAIYDPQNSGKISGGTTGAGTGGVLSMVGESANAGSIRTDANSGGAGGSINLVGESNPGGSIEMYGNSGGPGGSIDTHGGGGSINTRGTGSIELGNAGSRTTITGNASIDRNVSFPDASGTVYLTASPVTPAADGTYPVPTSITIVSGIITAIS